MKSIANKDRNILFFFLSPCKPLTWYKPLSMTLIWIIIALFSCTVWAKERLPSADAPKTVGGFSLGESIDRYDSRIKKESRMCIRYQDYLDEVEVHMCEAFKSGLISIANCERKNQVVRIKLKYQNESRDFYETLLKRFKKKFGEPDQWKGDAFGVMVAWKWSFKNENGENISMILQHNSQDEDLKMGNAIKLSNTTAIENESVCFEKRGKEKRKGKGKNEKKNLKHLDLSDPAVWEYLIPH